MLSPCEGTKFIAYLQIKSPIWAILFSERAKGAVVLGFRGGESGQARRETVERSGRIFTRRINTKR